MFFTTRMWTDKIMGIIKRTLNRVVTIPGTSVGIIVWSTVFVNHPPNNNNNNHHHHMSADDLALEHFRQYLRIPSVHPDPDYEPCVEFLKKQASSLGLPVQVVTTVPGKPVVIITWEGLEPGIPSVLLNSHMDVVPIFKDGWHYPPFGAEMDDEGNIYARGSQDMKCVGIQYIESIRRLKAAGTRLRRTIHMCFVPDEEIGSEQGMKVFVKSPEFKSLNVGFALDEGLASPDEVFPLFYGERYIWKVHVICDGPTGHGSLLLPNTAGEKLRVILDKFTDYRSEQKKLLASNPELTIGDVTTVNLVQICGGVQNNVIPERIIAIFDCRIAITTDSKAFDELLTRWCKEAGSDVTYKCPIRDPPAPPTRIDNTNPFWVAFKKATDEMKLKIKPQIFNGGTDINELRIVGIPAFNFSPMNYTKVLLHDHDEYLNKDIFLRGIEIYKNIIVKVANVKHQP